MICKRVLYSGQVQGVGFRYTTQQLAQGYPVAGYVRNLPDGTVELVAQGEPEAVDGFLQTVDRRMADFIDRAEVAEGPAEHYADFRIRH